MKKGYQYGIDSRLNSKHIHNQAPDGKEWKQKSDGSPYELNHKKKKRENCWMQFSDEYRQMYYEKIKKKNYPRLL